MSYIQGTSVKVTFTVRDMDTGLPLDPPNVQVAVQPPAGVLAIQSYDAGTGEIEKLRDNGGNPIVGLYRATINTSPTSGVWTYEVAALGANGVRARRSFTVDPWLSP